MLPLAESPPERRSLLRFALLVVLILGGLALVRWSPLAGYLHREELVATLETLRESWWAPLAFGLLYLVLCPLGAPVSPLMFAGGVVFGAFLGTAYNFAGTFLGGTVTYFLGRHLGREFIVRVTGERLRRVERLFARHGFWTLLRVRFLPIPYPLVNYGAALAGVRPSVFLSSTALGLVPAVTLYTYFAVAVFHAAAGERAGIVRNLLLAGLLLFLLTFLPQVWTGLQRRRRYRRLREHRRRTRPLRP